MKIAPPRNEELVAPLPLATRRFYPQSNVDCQAFWAKVAVFYLLNKLA